MFSNDRDSMRRLFQQAWAKHQSDSPMQALEQLIAQVVSEHPEYQAMLQQGDAALQRDYFPEDGATNPFLHMGMHISLREQIAVDRPAGIRLIHNRLATGLGDIHEAEHQMMECLGLSLWEAQRNAGLPDEQAYLDCLRGLPRRPR